MFVLIDNYDSFTFNLWHYLGELGAEVTVHRNDVVTPADVLALKPQGIVISPGPCDPDKAGICLDLIAAAAGKVPILGVCLGHQCIGQAFGAKIVLAPKPMHGKVSTITHDGTGVFAGIDSPFTATRYHSLTIDPATVPDCLRVTARSEDDVIQGIAHRDMPIYGVQFHPESIASENGHTLLRNFIGMTGAKAAA
ncbi:aminodeoxychorismate/anthranilate synthase component II [Thalassospiraceae bacterium LMO-SO8]|nr:aminodeoxychorismate/anthranilate synthase component II [Alphaproteobacteria bacterium LMO-S08]WND75721.1 aminodeoxychorismate/anthranilate synthase component II [Thalassospiraceae bacterium LMO-SO8]